jgi:hypothetical protein
VIAEIVRFIAGTPTRLRSHFLPLFRNGAGQVRVQAGSYLLGDCHSHFFLTRSIPMLQSAAGIAQLSGDAQDHPVSFEHALCAFPRGQFRSLAFAHSDPAGVDR